MLPASFFFFKRTTHYSTARYSFSYFLLPSLSPAAKKRFT